MKWQTNYMNGSVSLNPSKTKFIVMRTANNPPNGLKLCINGTPLAQIGTHSGDKSTKFLGLHIDELLSWKTHIAHINKKNLACHFCN